MEKKLRLLIIAIAGIASFSLLLIANFSLYNIPSTLSKENISGISLFVDYNNNTIKVHKNFTLDNGKTTALDALEKWCDVKTIEFSWGIFVSEIDGVSGDWIYMVNNITPYVAAPKYQLDDEDEVKWQIKDIF
jgi:hypothetical protein